MEILDFKTAVVFVSLAVAAFAIDFFAHKKDEKISLKQAALWSIFWIGVAAAFGGDICILPRVARPLACFSRAIF